MSTVGFDALVLAGGRGTRLAAALDGDAVDKATVAMGQQRLVDRVVSAARDAGAARVIVVGPPHTGVQADETVREDPPFTGPLPALAAGLERVEREWVLLLPCDLERPSELCEKLVDAFDRDDLHDGVYARDASGHPQWLAGIYRVRQLRMTLAAEGEALADRPLRIAFTAAKLTALELPDRVTADIDTPTDLHRARASLAATDRHDRQGRDR